LAGFIPLAGAEAGEDVPEAAAIPILPNWTFVFRPYGWLSYLDGDVTVRGHTASVEVSPDELLQDLQMAWFSYAEARYGRIALFNDIIYAKEAISGGASRVRDKVGVNASLGLDLKQATVELGAAYQIAAWESGGGFKDLDVPVRSTAIDLLGGFRYWYQEADLGLSVSADIDVGGLDLRGSRAFARSGSVDWVDPFIGLRVRHSWRPGQEIFLRGDIGGFDTGSQFSWQVIGAYNFDIGTRDGINYSGLVGYRALSVDYEQGSGRQEYRYDVVQHGPILGLQLRF
jgi:hypothetical protein